MDPKCRAQVRAAAGERKVSDAKLDAMDGLIRDKAKQLAAQDRARWQSMSAAERTLEAAKAAMDDVNAVAARKKHGAALQILATEAADARVAKQKSLSGLTESGAVVRDLEHAQQTVEAIRNESIAALGDMIDAAQSKDGVGFWRKMGMRIFDLDNPGMTRDVVREIFANADGHTGNKLAHAGAKAWLESIERMRVRFNAAGGHVGKLAYGYLGQAHDMVRVLSAGREAWARKVAQMLDRERYVREDGHLMSDSEVLDAMRGAWDTLSSGGDNKRPPGAFAGSGARANRGSDHRVIHFRDGDAWMAYMQEFGQGSLYDSMMGHVGGMARDIALVERYGPNPEAQFRRMVDIAERADGVGSFANRTAGVKPEGYWNIVSGKTGMPENRALSTVGQIVRNVQTAAKLGGAVITSLTDTATIAAALHFNKLPYFAMLANLRGQFDKEMRDTLRSHGIIAESMASSLNRWTGDHMTHNLTGRVAGSVMKLSLMNAWTDTLRGAFAQTMMGGLARMAKKGWQQLDEFDRYLLERKGITEADWAIVTKAEATDIKGAAHLTPDSIRATGLDGADQVASKMLAYVVDEAQFAVTNPDLQTRAIVTGGGMSAGTVRGEAMRSFAQFKSFPIAMMTRHWRRMFETPQGLQGAPTGYGAKTAAGAAINRVAVFAGMNVTLMMLGGIVLQNKGLLRGQDPQDMTEAGFWLRALAQGGGAGYLGDLLFKDPTENRPTTAEQVGGSVLGPAGGAVAGLAGDLVWRNVWEAAKGKDTHAAAEALRWINAQAPYASLWWLRGAWEHWALHNMQETVNPGYLGRMQQRAQRDYGVGYWWTPGEAVPDRMPELP
jgi:hypothetical protein